MKVFRILTGHDNSPFYMKQRNNAFKSLTGSVTGSVTEKEIESEIELRKPLVSSKSLHLTKKQAMALHHFKIDLQIVAKLQKSTPSFRVGYYKENDSEVEISADGIFLCDNVENPLYPSGTISAKGYEFVKEKIKPEQIPKFIADMQDNQDINPFEYFEPSSLVYEFNRIRMTSSQKSTITKDFLDYKILQRLNTDLTKNADGSYKYSKYKQFHFISFDGHIEPTVQKWYPEFPNTWGSNSKILYSNVLLVGFCNSRPVYLKGNGWYSDGSKDYAPTYETLIVDDEIIQEYPNYEYLRGQIAYEFYEIFAWQTSMPVLESLSQLHESVRYNTEFREKSAIEYWSLINKYGYLTTEIYNIASAHALFLGLGGLFGTSLYLLYKTGATAVSNLLKHNSIRGGGDKIYSRTGTPFIATTAYFIRQQITDKQLFAMHFNQLNLDKIHTLNECDMEDGTTSCKQTVETLRLRLRLLNIEDDAIYPLIDSYYVGDAGEVPVFLTTLGLFKDYQGKQYKVGSIDQEGNCIFVTMDDTSSIEYAYDLSEFNFSEKQIESIKSHLLNTRLLGPNNFCGITEYSRNYPIKEVFIDTDGWFRDADKNEYWPSYETTLYKGKEVYTFLPYDAKNPSSWPESCKGHKEFHATEFSKFVDEKIATSILKSLPVASLLLQDSAMLSNAMADTANTAGTTTGTADTTTGTTTDTTGTADTTDTTGTLIQEKDIQGEYKTNIESLSDNLKTEVAKLDNPNLTPEEISEIKDKINLDIGSIMAQSYDYESVTTEYFPTESPEVNQFVSDNINKLTSDVQSAMSGITIPQLSEIQIPANIWDAINATPADGDTILQQYLTNGQITQQQFEYGQYVITSFTQQANAGNFANFGDLWNKWGYNTSMQNNEIATNYAIQQLTQQDDSIVSSLNDTLTLLKSSTLQTVVTKVVETSQQTEFVSPAMQIMKDVAEITQPTAVIAEYTPVDIIYSDEFINTLHEKHPEKSKEYIQGVVSYVEKRLDVEVDKAIFYTDI